MSINYYCLFFVPIVLASLSLIIFLIQKKRKRSAKDIYKLINKLEKKYIY